MPVSGKVYDILLAFLQNPGRLLSKDELLGRVWSGEFVEEGNLARNVSTLRKLLGDTDKQHRYIATVPGHGYRFVADVRSLEERTIENKVENRPIAEAPQAVTVPLTSAHEPRSRKVFWISAILIALFTVAWFSKDRLFSSSPTVKSLAVLPLRGIDPNDNYLGVGIADAVIRRLSASGQIAVRPTSAVLRYQNQEPDSLAAARELNTDAILEGNVQRSGDWIRVSVNLLRTTDGNSIWNDSFDMPSADILRVQDEVAQQVANSLKIRFDRNVGSYLAKYPVKPAAYDWYIKGLFSLDQRGFNHGDLDHMLDTIDYFKHSIDVDPNYALAHAELAFSYVWLALFVDPDEPKWVDLAHQEITRSEELDPSVAEPHVANALLFWSAYGGHQVELAIRELRLAKQLDPNLSGADLAALYGHAGLEQQAENELARALSIDPTSAALNELKGILPYLRGDADGWAALAPNTPMEDRILSRWYYMHKGLLDNAQKVLDKQAATYPGNIDVLLQQNILTALRGDSAKAEGEIPGAIARTQRNAELYHHRTFSAACIYALGGKSAEAVKWLRETANSGFPNYPLFAREPLLDRIRQSPEFIQFLAEQKVQWKHFEEEFPS